MIGGAVIMIWDTVNRRKFLRIKFPFTVHIYLSKESPISAYTENISEGGIKFTSRQEFKAPSFVNLEIYVKLKPVICKGKIVWVKQRISEYFENEIFFDVGVEFEGLSAEDKIAITERIEKITEERKTK